MDIIFGTSNQHKLVEVKNNLPNAINILSLLDINLNIELPETGDSLQANSLEKAIYLYQKVNKPCIADDSGLEVTILNGRPGAFSARYAGIPTNDIKNYQKLLTELHDKQDRSACFKTIITFIDEQGEATQFEGKLCGEIAFAPKGNNGFGYDPIFMMPDGRTLAEFTLEEKNQISHRAIALNKFITYINKKYINNINNYKQKMYTIDATNQR